MQSDDKPPVPNAPLHERAVVELPMTGERTAPDTDQENYWFRRHEVIYRWLLPRLHHQVVIEAGSGEGYGAGLISSVARSVCGLDYDLLACRHAASAYGKYGENASGRQSSHADCPNPSPAIGASASTSVLAPTSASASAPASAPASAQKQPQCAPYFVQCDLGAMPVATGTADIIVNSQVIEHLPDQPLFMQECHRCLRPGGYLLVTTPNRLTFTPEGSPINPFHLRELNAGELAELFLTAGFELILCAGVYHGSSLQELDRQWGGSIIQAQLEPYLRGEPWSPELIAAVDEVRAEDFEIREAPVNAIAEAALHPTVPTVMDDSLDLVFLGRKRNDA